jgi:hypothetical protein
MEILIRAQLVEAECGTVAAPFGLALRVFQHQASTRHHAKAKKELGNMLVRGLSIEEIARLLGREHPEVRDKVAEVGRACRYEF